MRYAEAQIRWHEGRIVGLDLPAVLAVAEALGYDPGALLPFMTQIEAGMLHGSLKRESRDA